MDIGGNKPGARDFARRRGFRTLTGDLSLDIKLTRGAWLACTAWPTSDPAFTVDLLGGARMLTMQNTLGWSFTGAVGSHPLAGRSGSTVVKDTLWDAIVGVKGTYTFGAERQWFIPYYFDIGTGQSDLTYQIAGGIGYRTNGVIWSPPGATWTTT
jgi:hypothetical protein